MTDTTFLFEVSWEVCNKVGGIYTVLRSKIKQVVQNLDSNYILIGPWLEQNKYFVEGSGPFFDEVRAALKAKNLSCRVGYWDTVGQPTVILIDFRNRYNVDNLLYNMWIDFGVDSLKSSYDYQEPVLFATAAGEVIVTLAESFAAKNLSLVAHFHEWLCGAGVLYIKKHSSEIATVFTSHATVLGRALSGNNRFIYDLPRDFNPDVEARKYGVLAKHTLERAAAAEASCFTTVSTITADEASIMLGKYPDKIVRNGLDIAKKQQSVKAANIAQIRAELLQIASKVSGKKIEDNALLWLTSGRYEFHNKGFDVLLKSLVKLRETLPADSPPIVLFLLVAVYSRTKQDSLVGVDVSHYPDHQNAFGLATHKINEPYSDKILNACNELGFNKAGGKVTVIYSDAYLSGSDGVFDISYEQLLGACDLTIFPSFYEPWGYTPLESIACSVPTITTNMSGFGYWVSNLKQDYENAIYILDMKYKSETEIIYGLYNCLINAIKQEKDPKSLSVARDKALAVATLADWKEFYRGYLEAYQEAFRYNALLHDKFDLVETNSQHATIVHEPNETGQHFYSFQYESPLPAAISDLRALAYNFWWSWHEEAKELFQKINPELWEQVRHNPVHFLNMISVSSLNKVVNNSNYMWQYNSVINEFKNYLQDVEGKNVHHDVTLNGDRQIAYFCMEYGIDECLPVYSGGLGILAGDFLKAVSDLNVPLIAIGLFYKQGYFRQNISSAGEQVAVYETWNTQFMPVREVHDATGKTLLTKLEILNRTIYVRAWEVKVGRISLYLLDTDVPENTPEDRNITNSLYGGSNEIRLIQEMVLGIGGAKFIIEQLNIRPILYHLNEGHSAFLLLERVKNFCQQGFSFDEACEVVRCSSVFTTHTPVPAGNETFPEELIRKYFVGYPRLLGVSIEKILGLAKDPNAKPQVFSMTAFALRLTLNSNAVSKIHGNVARSMWKDIWPGLLEDEVPIGQITNGVHVGTWLGVAMRTLYQDYLSGNWMTCNKEDWSEISSINNGEIWRAHQTQKEKLLGLVRKLVVEQYASRNESTRLINATLKNLDSNVLLLGLSRRFTSYKRNDLILRDVDRLAKLLTNEKRPIVMLMAGKAHPADTGGKELIHYIIMALRDKIFDGHIIFLEEYNIGLAKAVVSGVDVWINTPILGREACGTSGMKVLINGGLNFSTRDGWWEEAYSSDSKVGWEIESFLSIEDLERRNDMESMFLLNKLENEIAPLYYENRKAGYNQEWVDKMKASLLMACQYNIERMALDYLKDLYSPTIQRVKSLAENNYANLKSLMAWKNNIGTRFSTVQIKAVIVDGIKDRRIQSEGLIKIKLLLFAGKLNAHELRAEFILIRQSNVAAAKPIIINLERLDNREVGVLTYGAEYHVDEPGYYLYALRVLPVSEMLFRPQDVGIMVWG